jgi:hypothetical protein
MPAHADEAARIVGAGRGEVELLADFQTRTVTVDRT